MKTKNVTCIICPKGCNIEVDIENDKVINIRNNKCKRGIPYASAEVLNPVRVLTSTVKITKSDGFHHRLAVKSSEPVLKSKLFECMEIVKKAQVNAPIKMGDVVISNILDTGIDIIATRTIDS